MTRESNTKQMTFDFDILPNTIQFCAWVILPWQVINKAEDLQCIVSKMIYQTDTILCKYLFQS